jgi:hypothetical protein
LYHISFPKLKHHGARAWGARSRKEKRRRQRTVRQVVIYRVVLRRQLGEEQLGKVRNTWLFVLEALGHLSKLSLDLDHAVEDKMREHHQSVLLHHQFAIRQSPVQLIAVLVNNRAERDRDVAERDGDVAPDVHVPRFLQDAEEQVVVRIAEL